MIFGTFCLSALIHVFFLFKETRGKTLEEMDTIFDSGSIWAFKKSEIEKELGLDKRVEAAKRDLENAEGLGGVDGNAKNSAIEYELVKSTGKVV